MKNQLGSLYIHLVAMSIQLMPADCKNYVWGDWFNGSTDEHKISQRLQSIVILYGLH